jgi:hypothetical protein
MCFLRGLACVAWLAAAGCERKAPGPDECRTFAYRTLHIPPGSERTDARLRLRLDEQTRTCLVTPYDRQLLRCVERGVPQSVCKREFDARSARRK